MASVLRDDDLIGTVENVCGARFLSEKSALFSDTRRLLNSPAFSTYLYDIYVIDSEEKITQWLAESLPVTDEFLLKFLLFHGFYLSNTTDLGAYVDEVLGHLEAEAISVIRRHHAMPEQHPTH